MKVIVAGLSALVLTAGLSYAEPQSVENLVKPSISFAKAMEITSKAEAGDIVSLELDHYGNIPVYLAEVESDTSHTVMQIDGKSGEIIAKNKTTASSATALHAMLEELDHQDHCEDDDQEDDDQDKHDGKRR